jgi:hypothetical protein
MFKEKLVSENRYCFVNVAMCLPVQTKKQLISWVARWVLFHYELRVFQELLSPCFYKEIKSNIDNLKWSINFRTKPTLAQDYPCDMRYYIRVASIRQLRHVDRINLTLHWKI